MEYKMEKFQSSSSFIAAALPQDGATWTSYKLNKPTTMWNKTSRQLELVKKDNNRGVPRGGFQGFPETPLDFTHQLKHSEIEAKGLQNMESVMEQDMF